MARQKFEDIASSTQPSLLPPQEEFGKVIAFHQLEIQSYKPRFRAQFAKVEEVIAQSAQHVASHSERFPWRASLRAQQECDLRSVLRMQLRPINEKGLQEQGLTPTAAARMMNFRNGILSLVATQGSEAVRLKEAEEAATPQSKPTGRRVREPVRQYQQYPSYRIGAD